VVTGQWDSLCAPLWYCRGDVQIVDTKALRRSPAVLVLAVTFFVLIDVVIDPVALRGSRWFLGQIYGYYGLLTASQKNGHLICR
jgi:putative membrane protein